MRNINTIVLLLVVSCLLLVRAGAMAKRAASADNKRQVFIGVFREGAPRNMNYIKKYEEQVGKKPAMIMWYQDWAQEFPRQDAQAVVDYGAVPQIVWEPWYWGAHDKIHLQDIVNGTWDNYIRSWAKDIKLFGQTVFLRPAHEFNIDGYPWGLVNNNKDPELYIKAFRHIVDIFKKEGTTNVKWVWCFMNYSYPKESWNDWTLAYPGDNYVDWIGIDGYNWGTTQSWSNWEAFKYLFREQMRLCRQLWPSKPVMVAEFASAEQGGSKADWIKELPGFLKTSMRDIDLIVWFDLKKETDWSIKSSSQSLAAFQSIMKDPIFSSSGENLAKFTVSAARLIKNKAYAVPSPGPVVIDGQLADWDKSQPIIMNNINFFKEGESWGGPSDLSGTAYLMWDAENLYLAAIIADKIPLVNKKSGQDIWNGDALEVVLGTKAAADQKRASFDSGDYQLGFSTGDGKGNAAQIWSWQRRRSPDGSAIVVKKTAEPQGYILEAKVPWSFFRKFSPVAGLQIPFDLAFDDADSSGERERQFIWNGDFYFYKDPSVWGILEFK